jgi:hypothetical protein
VPGEIPQDRYTGTFNIDSRLGPDAFGYEARSFPYENLDLVKDAPGTFVVMDDKDDVSIPLDLGANTFSFYGTNYTGPSKLYVSDNGIITLGGGNTVYPDFDLTTNPVAATIAPLWDDWLTNATPNDMVLGRFDDLNHDGAPDRLVIEWSSVRRYADPGPETAKDVTFQAILSLNTGAAPGAIVFNYRDIDTGSGYSNGGDATVGIKGVGDQTFEGRRLLVSQNRGNYPLVASGRAIRIAQGPSEVVGRRLFYNGSAFDEGNPAANWHDDAAIAPDKFAYTNPPAPGGARATFVNVSSYTRGINGVMVDLARLYNKLPVVSDFDFRAATDPAGPWSLAPTPSLSIRRNDGASGSDRLTFVWPDNAIRNTWLRVTVKATPSTGLSAPDVFYFGHLAGESGDAAADTGAVVTALDVTHTRAAMTPAAVGLASRFDFNRDGRVDTRDLATARSNQQASLPWLSAANTANAGPNYTLRPPVEVFRDSPTRRTELLLDDSPPVL